MTKRFLMAVAAALMTVGFVGPAPAQACGGNYLVAVEADSGQGVSYCSDGTLEPFIPADGDGSSSCGGNYAVAVETENIDLPDGAPFQSVSYCSDGTLDELPG